MSRIGVKVLWEDRGSVIVGNQELTYCPFSACRISTGRVIYPVGKWKKPRQCCGPLTVFETLKYAEMFVRGQCEGDPRCLIVDCEFKATRSKYLWAYENEEMKTQHALPEGGILASAVKCLQ